MNSLERVRRACRHESTDRVPVGSFAGFCAARLTGVSLRRYVTDGQAIADAQVALQHAVGHDIVVTAADTYYLAQGFGLEVEFHDDALPTAKRPLLTELSDVDQLRVPDPQCDGRMPVYLDAVRLLSAALGDRVAIRGTGTGPFSIAAYLFGMQRFLMLLAEIETRDAAPDDERRVHQLLSMAADASAAFLKAQLEAGAHILYLGDSLASADVISPAMYRRFAMPYHQRIFAEVNGRGAFTLLHICGDNTPMLDALAETGANILEIDHKMDLGLCKQRVGDRVCLIGNLDPVQIILHGSTEDVRHESRRCIEQAGQGGGFILGTGCFVPYDSPLENLRAMVETTL
jgi:uroporphyrinogen decarboxylase